MDYCIKKRTTESFEETIEKLTKDLSEHGFGIITEVDVQQTFKNKLGINFDKYKILGACNPEYANKVLSEDKSLGVFLPCNVIVTEEKGVTEIYVVDPVTTMASINNRSLTEFAQKIKKTFSDVLEKIN